MLHFVCKYNIHFLEKSLMHLGWKRNFWLTDFSLLIDCFHKIVGHTLSWFPSCLTDCCFSISFAGSSFSFHSFNFWGSWSSLFIFIPSVTCSRLMFLNTICVPTTPKFIPLVQNSSEFQTDRSNCYRTSSFKNLQTWTPGCPFQTCFPQLSHLSG